MPVAVRARAQGRGPVWTWLVTVALTCAARPSVAEPAAPTPAKSAAAPEVLLLPLRPVPARGDLQAVADALRIFYGFEVEIAPASRMPKAAWTAPRRRWRADKLLDWLEPRARALDAPGRRQRVLAVTAADISTTKGKVRDWGVLGLATLDGHVAVISTFRARRGVSARVVRERLAKTAVHELGHSLGLDHCPTHGCLMQDAGGKVATTDGEWDLCASCRATLARHRVVVPVFGKDGPAPPWRPLTRPANSARSTILPRR